MEPYDIGANLRNTTTYFVPHDNRWFGFEFVMIDVQISATNSSISNLNNDMTWQGIRFGGVTDAHVGEARGKFHESLHGAHSFVVG
jgi:hypothetical protein